MAQQTENNKMTAVEWLEKICNDRGYHLMSEYFIQAKQMEKEQHYDTWTDSRIECKGDDYVGKEKTFEQYYNETYGNP